MALVLDDPTFYGFAAAVAQVAEALGPAADNIIRRIVNFADGQCAPVETTAPDPILLELEHLMIEELFDSTFVNRPLNKPMEIRILLLHPGSPSESLRGTIQHEVLLKKSQVSDVYYVEKNYEAISYVWGSESKPCSILLNGCRMALTRSLFNALIRLRYSHKDRRLWPDGFCTYSHGTAIKPRRNLRSGISIF